VSKNTILSLGFLLLSGALITFIPVIFSRIEGEKSYVQLSPSPQQKSNNSSNIFKEEVEYQGKSYKAIGFIVDDSEKLYLYPNFSEKLTSYEAMKEYGCSVLLSGGLYTKESSPIGLFISEGMKLKSMIQDEFYNGIFSVFYDERVEIANSLDKGDARIALQSGPILVLGGERYDFNDRSKEEARRVVIGLTNEDKIIFMVFYNQDSVFIGPTLEILSKLVADFSEKSGFTIIDALNLDGGSASLFKADDVSLSEITPSGSFFCIK